MQVKHQYDLFEKKKISVKKNWEKNSDTSLAVHFMILRMHELEKKHTKKKKPTEILAVRKNNDNIHRSIYL